ncbi:hypothetical protein DV735_g295, partial [Chaetothyriales sp. CBS 134920]
MSNNVGRGAEQPEVPRPEPEPESPYKYVDDILHQETEAQSSQAAKEAAQRCHVLPGKTLVLSMMDKPTEWDQMDKSGRFRLKRGMNYRFVQTCGASNVWFEEDGVPKKSQDILAFHLDYFAAFEVMDDPAFTQAFKDTHTLTTRLCNNSTAEEEPMTVDQFDELVGAIYRRNQAYKHWADKKREEAARRAEASKLVAPQAVTMHGQAQHGQIQKQAPPATQTRQATKETEPHGPSRQVTKDTEPRGPSRQATQEIEPRGPTTPPTQQSSVSPLSVEAPVSSHTSTAGMAGTASTASTNSGKRKAAAMSTGGGQDNGPASKKRRSNKNNQNQPMATSRPAVSQAQRNLPSSAVPPAALLRNQIARRYISHVQQNQKTPPQKFVSLAQLSNQSKEPSSGQATLQQVNTQAAQAGLQQRNEQAPAQQCSGPPATVQQHNGQAIVQQRHAQAAVQRPSLNYGGAENSQLMHAHYVSVVQRYLALLKMIKQCRRLQNGNRIETGETEKSLRDVASLLDFKTWSINLSITPEHNMHDLARRHLSRLLNTANEAAMLNSFGGDSASDQHPEARLFWAMTRQKLEVEKAAGSVQIFLSRHVSQQDQWNFMLQQK